MFSSNPTPSAVNPVDRMQMMEHDGGSVPLLHAERTAPQGTAAAPSTPRGRVVIHKSADHFATQVLAIARKAVDSELTLPPSHLSPIHVAPTKQEQPTSEAYLSPTEVEKLLIQGESQEQRKRILALQFLNSIELQSMHSSPGLTKESVSQEAVTSAQEADNRQPTYYGDNRAIAPLITSKPTPTLPSSAKREASREAQHDNSGIARSRGALKWEGQPSKESFYRQHIRIAGIPIALVAPYPTTSEQLVPQLRMYLKEAVDVMVLLSPPQPIKGATVDSEPQIIDYLISSKPQTFGADEMQVSATSIGPLLLSDSANKSHTVNLYDMEVRDQALIRSGNSFKVSKHTGQKSVRKIRVVHVADWPTQGAMSAENISQLVDNLSQYKKKIVHSLDVAHSAQLVLAFAIQDERVHIKSAEEIVTQVCKHPFYSAVTEAQKAALSEIAQQQHQLMVKK